MEKATKTDVMFNRLATKGIIAILLVMIVLIIFHQVGGFEFIRYDDELYVTKNSHVLSGLTGDGVRWAFTTLDAGFWHPLTWLSLMLDQELYGMNAGGYHWTNVLLHLTSGVLLFFVMCRMTRQIWCSGLVAVLFLVHPLHVEPVAWIGARKDVLSGLFWVLGLWAYVRYVERKSLLRYGGMVLFFVMGLMSKAMVVTFPFALLLLDHWPFRRFDSAGLSVAGETPASSHGWENGGLLTANPVFPLILEKLPLIFLSIASGGVTWLAEKEVGALPTWETMPLDLRLANALISYARYLMKFLRPVDLSVFYPYPASWSASLVVLSGVILILISLLVLWRGKRHPYLSVGWLWFLGTLVPVIGILQVGSHAMADRYSYIPLIGLSVMVVWGMDEAFNNKKTLALLWGVMLSIMTLCSWHQTQYWRNSLRLFGHAIEATEMNFLAHNNYGVALMDQKDYRRAAEHFLIALQIKPDFATAYLNMGNIMVLQGKDEPAEAFYQRAIGMDARYAEAKRNLGDLLMRKGKGLDALFYYRQALVNHPNDPELYNNIGVALASIGEVQEAVSCITRAIDLRPGYAEARKNLDIVMQQQPPMN